MNFGRSRRRMILDSGEMDGCVNARWNDKGVCEEQIEIHWGFSPG